LRTYSAELKGSLVAKMLPPHNVGVPQLVRETGIPRDTLYGWRRQATGQGAAAATPATPAGSWSSEAKFAAVVETASLNELELGEYCRHKGLFPKQIGVWRETCRQANAALPTKAERAQQRAEREQVQYLTRELQRKDRALAEAAALLVLQKKPSPGPRAPRTCRRRNASELDSQGLREQRPFTFWWLPTPEKNLARGLLRMCVW